MSIVLKTDSPDELDSFAGLVFDGGDGEKIPERSAVLLVVQQPPAVASPIPHSLSNLLHFILVRLRSLEKPAAIEKTSQIQVKNA